MSTTDTSNQWYITVVNNGTTSGTTVTTTTRVGDLLTWLSDRGISADIVDGKVTLNPSENAYILAMGDNLAGLLKIQTDDTKYYTSDTTKTSYTTSSGSILTDTNSINMTTTHSLRDLKIGTTAAAGDVGADKKYTIAIGGTNSGTLTFTQDSTVDDILTSLAGYGIVGNVIDGKLTLTPTDGNYITAIEKALADALEISATGTSYYDSTVKAQANYDTTLAQLNFTGANETITVVNEGTEKTTTVATTTKVGDLLTWLSDNGISADIINGKVTLNPTEGCYIKDIGNKLANALHISKNDTDYYTSTTTTIVSGFNPTTATIASTTTTGMMTTSSTLEQIEYTSNTAATITLNDGTVLNFTKDDTINDVLTALAAYNIAGDITNGDLTLTTNGDYYIADMNETLKQKLHLATDAGYKTITAIASSTTTLGKAFTNNATKTVADSITVFNGSTVASRTFATTDTIGDVLTWLADNGISADIINGKVTLNPTEGCYITYMGTDIADALNVSNNATSYSKTTTETTGYNASQGEILTDTITTGLMKTESTLKQLGVANGSYTITIAGEGAGSITFNQDATVDDILTGLAGFGIVGNVVDGKLTLTSVDGNYITGMTAGLATAIGMSGKIGEDKSYNSTVTSITTETTMKEANTGFTTGTETIKVFNGSSSITFTTSATTTIGDILTWLSDNGISADVIDGKVTLNPTEGCYIESVGTKTAAALGITGATHYTRPSTTIGYNQTSDSLTDTFTVSMTTASTLAQIGVDDGSVITVVHEGKEHTIATRADMTVDDLLTTLAGYGISGEVKNGILTLNGTNDSYILKVGATENADTDFETVFGFDDGKDKTYQTYTVTVTPGSSTTSDSIDRIYTVSMTATSTMEELYDYSSLSTADGTIKGIYNGVEFTVNVTKDMTVGEVISALAAYGISGTIKDGKLTLTPAEGSYITDISTNVLNALKLEEGLGKTYNTTITKGTKDVEWTDTLGSLTNASGGKLISTFGSIYVYHDGTRTAVAISANDTVNDLAAKLAPYDIDVVLNEGKLYLDGDNNSYVEDIGSANICAGLGINGTTNWKTLYDSKTEVLTYEVDGFETATGDTAVTDLYVVNGSGNTVHAGVTEGAYSVFSRGVQTYETITDETTVDDLIATMGTYGLIGNQATDGSIAVGADHETYLATSATGDDTSMVANLFAEWDFVNIYTTKGLEVPQDVTIAITETTKLADLDLYDYDGDGDDDGYKAGKITVVKDGVQTDITLTADDTVGTLMNELALFGFESTINDDGQLIIKTTGDSMLLADTSNNAYSNALGMLGVSADKWIKTNSYLSDELVSVVTTSTLPTAMTRDSLLSEIGVSTGEYYIYKDGVKYTALISSDETLGSFIDTLATFGIQANIVTAPDGSSSVLQIIGDGSSYVAESVSTVNKSNVVQKLFPNSVVSSYDYSSEMKTELITSTYASATLDLELSYYDTPTKKAQGDLVLNIDGVENVIKITADDTFDSLIEKFQSLGLEASLSNGTFMIQSGYKELFIDTGKSTSKLVETLGLQFNNDLGGYVASNTEVQQTVWEEDDLSVANYATDSTTMKLLNITSGTLSVFRNGERATINLDENDTFTILRSKISSEFSDLDIRFENGYIEFYSKTGQAVEVGATTDTSNFSAICGLVNDKSGSVKSARELFCVNGDSKVTNAGLFRRGTVTKGTFTVGTAEFTIDENTTMQSLISQINAREDANATAYWDSIDGKLVIKSRTTGSSFINIEAGSSNFTDIMGYTTSEWGNGATQAATKTQLDIELQDVGENAIFSINGTQYSSTSNTIGSDISRIAGVTINLKGVSNGETVELVIEKDKETVANAVSDIVDSYNELMENVSKEIAKDGQLHDQTSLKLLRNRLRSLMTSSLPGVTGVYKNLDSIGIEFEKASGTNLGTENVDMLYFNKDKFISAFDSDLDSMKELLVGTDTIGNRGIFLEIKNVLETSLMGASGYFASADRSYGKQIDRLNEKIKKANEAVSRYQERLEAKFSAMDMLIANIQNQYSSFLG